MRKIQFSIVTDKVNCLQCEAENLEQLAETIIKNDWSQGLFKDNYRKAENFYHADVIGLDVDDGLSLEDAKKCFREYQHIIIPSKSHGLSKNGKIADRFRVVLPLSQTITKKEIYSATWESLFQRFPFIDKAAKDCSRFYYSCPHPIASINLIGRTVDLAEDLPGNSAPLLIDNVLPHAKGRLSNATNGFLVYGAPHGQWNDSLYKAAKDAQQNGWTEELFLTKAKNITGSLDEKDRATIQSAFKNEPLFEPRCDHNTGLRNLILGSYLVVDQRDARKNILLQKETGTTHDIDVANIKAVLRNNFPDYQQKRKIIAKFDYLPHKHEFLIEADNSTYTYNEYRPPSWKKPLFLSKSTISPHPMPQIHEIFLRHLTSGDDASYEYLIDWIATSLQGRNLTILTAIGEEGIGKGILGEILEDLHGKDNFVKVRDTVFKEKFNGPLQNKTLVYVDEIKLDSRESLDRIKDVVNWQIEIEKKGEDPRSIRNYASFYLSSNSFDAVPIEPGQRRFSVIELTDQKLKDASFIREWPSIQEFVEEIRSDENIEMFASYLYSRKIERDMISVFLSERVEEIKEAGLKEWERWVLFDWVPNSPKREYSIEELQNKIKEKFSRLNPPGRRKLEDLAKSHPDKIKVKRGNGSDRIVEIVRKSSIYKAPNGASIPTELDRVLAQVEKENRDHPFFKTEDYLKGKKTK